MRVDVNVSVANRELDTSTSRTEIKNLNSLRNMVRAIDTEVKRHREHLEAGRNVKNETRNYDVGTNTTVRTIYWICWEFSYCLLITGKTYPAD